MVLSVHFMRATLLALALASPVAKAETQPAKQSTIHAREKHHRHAEKPKEEGRQVTVNKGTPSWLTLGSGASVNTGNNYVTSTFDQPSTVEGTFSGYRGRERLVNQYGVPGAPLFQFF
jgi:hypothetical protein